MAPSPTEAGVWAGTDGLASSLESTILGTSCRFRDGLGAVVSRLVLLLLSSQSQRTPLSLRCLNTLSEMSLRLTCHLAGSTATSELSGCFPAAVSDAPRPLPLLISRSAATHAPAATPADAVAARLHHSYNLSAYAFHQISIVVVLEGRGGVGEFSGFSDRVLRLAGLCQSFRVFGEENVRLKRSNQKENWIAAELKWLLGSGSGLA